MLARIIRPSFLIYLALVLSVGKCPAIQAGAEGGGNNQGRVTRASSQKEKGKKAGAEQGQVKSEDKPGEIPSHNAESGRNSEAGIKPQTPDEVAAWCDGDTIVRETPAPIGSALGLPTVARCVVLRNSEIVNTTEGANLGGVVTIVLRGLREWVRRGQDANQLRLYLAGRMIPDAGPFLINLSQQYVNYDLHLSPTDKSLWVQIIAEANRQPGHKIPISVGLLDQRQPFDSSSYVTFKVYPQYAKYILPSLVILLIAFIFLGVKYDLLRDSVAKAPPCPARRPYSLARVQMAVWFYIVIASFLYIWLITGEHNTPTSSVLALIGISAGTGLAAIFVDDSKETTTNDRRAALESQSAALEMRIQEIGDCSPPEGSTMHKDLQQKLSDLSKVKADIAQLPAVPPTPVSKGFISDLLGAGQDMSFHRFQIAVWTIVLALIFAISVYQDLAMPDFAPALLGLMGISSGTYLGFKFPEKSK